MIVTTTPTVEGRPAVGHLGIVTGEAIVGANVFRDVFARVRDIVGGRAAGYEKALRDAKELAMADMIAAARELGADAVVGVDLDYEAIGNSMLMVSVNGTAVALSTTG